MLVALPVRGSISHCFLLFSVVLWIKWVDIWDNLKFHYVGIKWDNFGDKAHLQCRISPNLEFMVWSYCVATTHINIFFLFLICLFFHISGYPIRKIRIFENRISNFSRTAVLRIQIFWIFEISDHISEMNNPTCTNFQLVHEAFIDCYFSIIFDRLRSVV